MSELKEQAPSVEDFLMMFYMQQQRTYDVLLVILESINPERYEQLTALHQEFGNVGPLPFKETE